MVAGFVGDEVSAVRLELGSGRVLEVRPRTFEGGRYVAVRIPRGEAVRSVSAIGSDAVSELGEPPSGLPCVGSGAFAILAFEGELTTAPPLPPGSGEQVGAEAGGHLTRRARSVRVGLRGGRTLRPRIVGLPRRLGGGRAFVLALPRRARVKALRIGGDRVTFPLLPASRQCGYRLYAPYLSG